MSSWQLYSGSIRMPSAWIHADALGRVRIRAHLTVIPGTLDRDSGLLGPVTEALVYPGLAVLFLPWFKKGLAVGQP